jgi:hypothetical protein
MRRRIEDADPDRLRALLVEEALQQRAPGLARPAHRLLAPADALEDPRRDLEPRLSLGRLLERSVQRRMTA